MDIRPRLPLLSRRSFLQIGGLTVGGLSLLTESTALLAQTKANDHYGLIILNDGYVLQGKVMREDVTTENDPVTGTPFSYPKGFFLVDDGPRRIVFSQKQVRLVTKMDAPQDDLVKYPPPVVRSSTGKAMPPVLDVIDPGDWDIKLEREFKFRYPITSGLKDVTLKDGKLKQRIGAVTPYFVRVDSTELCAWPSVYLTRELTPEVVGLALRGHPDIQDQPKLADAQRAGRRLRYADFFTRAGWYDQAEAELQDILKQFPDQPDLKERVVERQKATAKLRSREDFEQIKRLHNAGQYSAVHERLKSFPEDNVPEDTLALFRELKSDYDSVKERGAQADAYLKKLNDPKKLDKNAEVYAEAVKAIQDDLYFDSLARLETFLSQAKQAERQESAGKKPDLNAAELLALAVTGYYLGNGAAEADPAAAARLWRTRKFLIEYLQTAGATTREKLLTAYLAQRQDSTALDDFARIIPTLPPVDPEAKIITDKTVTVPLGKTRMTYDLKLPPEYRHSRPYPVLLVLHKSSDKSSETPAEAIDKWAAQAAENGYILAAPEWENKNNRGTYSYGDAQEHEVVLATLRDLRRRFQIDSDRVFLFGQGQGANMAHDVGLSHPDLFAGVSSMGADPQYHALGYWRNGQYLPFYVVTGTNSGKYEEHVHDLFQHWAGRSFPMLWVQYKGRGADWFGGELPNIFDWMRTKRRAFPLRQLGSGVGGPMGSEFYTSRPSDNSFYWLTTNNVQEQCWNLSLPRWRKVEAARMTAIVDATRNEIHVSTFGIGQFTVWIGRNAKGETLIDLDKEVTVKPNLGSDPVTKKYTPSATVMLEDLYDRCDRHRLFLVKIPYPTPK
jgi:hypothetical protein